jgi:hypothetical protein
MKLSRELQDSEEAQRKERPFAKEIMVFAVGDVSGLLNSEVILRLQTFNEEEYWDVEDQLGYSRIGNRNREPTTMNNTEN